jgi:hypothetical protein
MQLIFFSVDSINSPAQGPAKLKLMRASARDARLTIHSLVLGGSNHNKPFLATSRAFSCSEGTQNNNKDGASGNIDNQLLVVGTAMCCLQVKLFLNGAVSLGGVHVQ